VVTLRYLKRGALAGLLGGALAGAFGYLLAEPVMDRAVALEAARAKASGEHVVELYSRHTQHLGFLGATAAVGLALGVLLGVLHGALHRADPDRDPWRRALQLGGCAFFGVYLVPFLRYPANPPGVGDPGTIDARTHAYVIAVVIGIVGAVTVALAAGGLAERGWRASHRQLAVLGLAVLTLAITFVLPADTDEIGVGPALLWQFRLLALATSALLWGGMTVAFGLLGERAATRVPADARDLTPV